MIEMQAIERELATLQNDWADAEAELVQRTAQMERLRAPHRLKLKIDPSEVKLAKPTVEDLNAVTLDWLWEEHGELMEALVAADARVAACKVTYKCAERALSSKQSRLSADVRLQGVTPQ